MLTLIHANISYLQQIQQLSRDTFFETFQAVNTPENMQLFLDAAYNIEKLSNELNDTNTRFYLLLADDEPAGYIKINFGDTQTEIKDKQGIEIERIYVLQKFQGRQFGKTLFEKAMDIAKHRGALFIWLGVWEHNLKAIQFYKKLGFQAISSHPFWLGNDKQTDIIMKLYLPQNAE